MSRLFFALCQNDTVRSHFIDLIRQIPGTRCVSPQNLHLTLHFIGETDAQDCLIDRAQTIRCKPFSLMIDHYGYFNRAKVFWAGPKQYPDDLAKLAHNCSISSVACSCRDHDKSFTPHVSLMRKVSDNPELHNFEPFEWTAHSFCLMESESNQAGVQYRMIREFPIQEK
ncbi:MAG: RNA 2',3'-cyclic phosphodiesterase [Methylococcales bacterium]